MHELIRLPFNTDAQKLCFRSTKYTAATRKLTQQQWKRDFQQLSLVTSCNQLMEKDDNLFDSPLAV